jgi:hypothetical protein
MNAESNDISNAIAADVGETPLQATPAKVRGNVTLPGVETDLEPTPPDLRGDINRVRLRGLSSSIFEHQTQTRTPLLREFCRIASRSAICKIGGIRAIIINSSGRLAQW